jgi:hypothetical protein
MKSAIRAIRLCQPNYRKFRVTSMAEILQEISGQDCLTGKLSSNVKHEFVAGFMYGMVDGRSSHHAIATDVLISIGTQLKGKSCQLVNSDTKIRI